MSDLPSEAVEACFALLLDSGLSEFKAVQRIKCLMPQNARAFLLSISSPLTACERSFAKHLQLCTACKGDGFDRHEQRCVECYGRGLVARG